MKRLVMIALGLHLWMVVPAPRAEEALPGALGERLRVTYMTEGHPTRLDGRLTANSSDSLTIDPFRETPRALPWSAIRGIERYEGSRGHAGTGALIGLAIGVGGGVLAGTMAHRESTFFTVSSSEAVLIGTLVAGAGAGIGALFGLLVRSDRWRKIPVEEKRPSSQP